MKVLLVSDYGTPTGGAELMLLTLRDGLRARGHEVRFFSSDARPLGAGIAADYTCRGTTSRWRTLLQCSNPWAVRGLRRVLREFRPDIVHARLFLTQLSPRILPLLARIPSLLHVDTYRTVCPTGSKWLPDGTPCRAPAGRACRRNGCLPRRDWPALMWQMRAWRDRASVFDLIVSSSDFVRRRLAEGGIRVGAVVPNGVAVRPPAPPAGAAPLLAFAGRLVPEKGAGVLIEALSRLRGEFPTLRAVIAGDGPERHALERRAAALGLADCVSFPGHLAADARERALAGAWVQAIPSLWAEPFGNVAVEAMMRGTVAVASNAGGLPEIVGPQRGGVLVEPGDPVALADALRPLFADRRRCERIGAEGRRRALARYSADTHVARMEELHASLVA